MIYWSKSFLVFWIKSLLLKYLFYVLKSIWINFLLWIFLWITQIKFLSYDFCHLFKFSEYMIFIEKYIFFLLDELDFCEWLFHDYVMISNVLTQCDQLILNCVINNLMYFILDLLHALWKIFLFSFKESVQFIVHAYKACLICKLFKIFLYFKMIFFFFESIFCRDSECS